MLTIVTVCGISTLAMNYIVECFYVLERNLNPKAACLKRREEEKTEELPGSRALGPPDDLQAPPHSIPGKVCISPSLSPRPTVYNTLTHTCSKVTRCVSVPCWGNGRQNIQNAQDIIVFGKY